METTKEERERWAIGARLGTLMGIRQSRTGGTIRRLITDLTTDVDTLQAEFERRANEIKALEDEILDCPATGWHTRTALAPEKEAE